MAEEETVFVLPKGIQWDPIKTAGFPVAMGTAHVALMRGGLKNGEKLLVTGASGGTGMCAIMLGKKMGCKVFATARGKAKCEACRKLGADAVVDLTENSSPDLKAFTGGVDVVYECVGDPLFSLCLKALRWNGRMLVIGFAGGKIPSVKANITLVKNISVVGVYWGAHFYND